MSNIEPLVREVCEGVCLRTGMPEAKIPAWVDSHWEAVAAEIEVGNCDDAARSSQDQIGGKVLKPTGSG